MATALSSPQAPSRRYNPDFRCWTCFIVRPIGSFTPHDVDARPRRYEKIRWHKGTNNKREWCLEVARAYNSTALRLNWKTWAVVELDTDIHAMYERAGIIAPDNTRKGLPNFEAGIHISNWTRTEGEPRFYVDVSAEVRFEVSSPDELEEKLIPMLRKAIRECFVGKGGAK